MRHDPIEFQDSYAFAAALDRADTLNGFREKFIIPDSATYLCGNCLGLQPKSASSYIAQALLGWAKKGFRAHFTPPQSWLSYEQDCLTLPMADIIGALPIETTLMNSLSVNLHLMLTSFYRPQKERHKILIEAGAFPSDQFAVHSQIKLHGYTPEQTLIQIGPPMGTNCIDMDELLELIDARGDEIALILLGNTSFRSGQVLDTATITRAGHQKGCIVGFDLAHAVGNIELHLHDWEVDFAVWCSYKYLNAGPGSVGGCYVHERYAQSTTLPRLEGWWGNQQSSRFSMKNAASFESTQGAQGWQLSSPPILSMAALHASLDIFAETSMAELRRKSVRLGDYLLFLLDKKIGTMCESLTPRDAASRGCQFTLKVNADASKLQSWLLEQGVICDVQGNDTIRVSPTPLYNRFMDIYRLIAELEIFFERYANTEFAHAPAQLQISQG